MNQQQEKIIEAAFDLFREKGYEETTTREIAARADMRKGLLYYYFNKKEDIVFMWYRNFLNTIYQAIQRDLGEASDPESSILSLTTFLFVYYRTLEADPFTLSLIYCVLTHHDLTKRKIEYTSDFYCRVLPSFDREKILADNAMLIGGESQLLPMIVDHEITMTISDFTEQFIQNFLDHIDGKSRKKKEIYQKARQHASKYNLHDYQNFINDSRKKTSD